MSSVDPLYIVLGASGNVTPNVANNVNQIMSPSGIGQTPMLAAQPNYLLGIGLVAAVAAAIYFL